MSVLLQNLSLELTLITIEIFLLISITRRRTEDSRSIQFRNTLIAILCLSISNFVCYATRDTGTPIHIQYLFSILYYFFVSLSCVHWIIYELMIIHENAHIEKSARFKIMIPSIIMTVLAVSSPFTHWVFYFDAEGYHRGSYFLMQYAILGIYYFVFAGILISSRLKDSGSHLYTRSLTVFLFIATVVLGIQIVYGGSYINSMFALSTIFAYTEFYTIELRRLDDSERDFRIHEEMKEQYAIVNVLSMEYQDIFLMDLDNNISITLKLSGNVLKKESRKSRSYSDTWERYIETYVHPDDVERVRHDTDRKNVKKYLEDKGEYIIMYRIVLADGAHSYQASFRKLIIDASERLIVGFRNVDEIIKLEQKRQHELEEALENAQRANLAKTSFLNNMSHDIRTPMNAILGFTELIQSHGDDPVLRSRYIENIRVSGKHLMHLINNVLEMSRIESGNTVINNEPTDILAMAGDLRAILAGDFEQAGLTVERHIEIPHRWVMADRTKLNEIFINILNNSIKYSNAGGKVTISINELSCSKDKVCYRAVIADTGIGMSSEFLPHVFDSFSRERNTTQSKVTGTGLGMGIVKHLVELLGGSIKVESELGVGTSVTVELTLTTVERFDEEVIKLPPIAPEFMLNKLILLAEDNDLNAEITMELFHDAGFKMERVENGKECYERISSAPEGHYDLVLMDIQMPVMDGYQATRAIRQLDNAVKANIPIIAMTANAFDEDRKNAFDSGMDAFITKPIDVYKLVVALHKVLTSKNDQTPV